MRENTTLIRQVALLSIIAMAVVALSAGVATADHDTPEGEVTLSAPETVTTGEEFDVYVDVPDHHHHGFDGVSVVVYLDTSEGSDKQRTWVESGTSKTITVSTDGLGQADGEATIQAEYVGGPFGSYDVAEETVNLREPLDLPWWITFLPDWIINLYL
jgi:hypothetical protein